MYVYLTACVWSGCLGVRGKSHAHQQTRFIEVRRGKVWGAECRCTHASGRWIWAEQMDLAEPDTKILTRDSTAIAAAYHTA
jgi:hypothetical protein